MAFWHTVTDPTTRISVGTACKGGHLCAQNVIADLAALCIFFYGVCVLAMASLVQRHDKKSS